MDDKAIFMKLLSVGNSLVRYRKILLLSFILFTFKGYIFYGLKTIYTMYVLELLIKGSVKNKILLLKLSDMLLSIILLIISITFTLFFIIVYRDYARYLSQYYSLLETVNSRELDDKTVYDHRAGVYGRRLFLSGILLIIAEIIVNITLLTVSYIFPYTTVESVNVEIYVNLISSPVRIAIILTLSYYFYRVLASKRVFGIRGVVVTGILFMIYVTSSYLVSTVFTHLYLNQLALFLKGEIDFLTCTKTLLLKNLISYALGVIALIATITLYYVLKKFEKKIREKHETLKPLVSPETM